MSLQVSYEYSIVNPQEFIRLKFDLFCIAMFYLGDCLFLKPARHEEYARMYEST